MLDGLMVNYYGTPTPLAQVANINSTDARTLVIKPWEKSLLSEVEKTIKNSDLGIQPQNDGEKIPKGNALFLRPKTLIWKVTEFLPCLLINTMEFGLEQKKACFFWKKVKKSGNKRN